MRFELTTHKAKLNSYSPRRELHGEDRKPAATLHFGIAIGAELLAMFSPTLRSALFYKDANAARSDLADQGSEAADLRFPEISAPIHWAHEIVGAKLTIHRGISATSNLVLPECMVDKFTLAPQQGAVVLVNFRVACHPDEKQSGKLAMIIDEECEITLEPPEPMADLAGDKPLNTAGNAESAPAGKKRPSKREARKAAEDAFAGAA